MLNQSLIVARKEIVDHGRDARAVASALLYSLMGPAIVLLVLIARTQPDSADAAPRRWTTMAAVFALMAAFTGAMAVATDLVAGERERRSLIPLLASTRSRTDVIIGKWLAASVFAAVGLLVNVIAFGVVFAFAGIPQAPVPAGLLMAPAFLMLAMLAAALEILISTWCRNVKEANTYLSMMVFTAMAVAMWVAFRTDAVQGWWRIAPVLGQQRLLEVAFGGGKVSTWQAVFVATQSVLLTATTAVLAVLALAGAWSLFRRDEAVYGG